MLKIIICVSIAIIQCNGAKFPADVPQCAIGDTECIKQTSDYVLATKSGPEDISPFNIPPIDPLLVSGIRIKQGAESPVNIELNFKNVYLYGLKQFRSTYISGFQQNPEGRYKMIFKGPQLVLAGPYTISGRVLVLPIQGTGHSNFTLENPELIILFTGKTKTVKNKQVLYTDDLKLTFKITRMRTYLGNLYNGDRALGDSTNQFLNANWQDIFNEIKPAIFDAFSLIIQSTLNTVFSRYDYRDLFSH